MIESLEYYLRRMNSLTNWEERPRGGMEVALEPIRDLVEQMAVPIQGLHFVHVTGTKGKGSVGSLIERAMGVAGYRTGRYSSPHVQSINERITIDGEAVSDECLRDALAFVFRTYDEAAQQNSAGAKATWFDVFTAAALFIFAKSDLEWVVMEVGLGGRLDSTNIISADVSVLTNVELEHTEILGDTRAKIAAEKLGILKNGGFLVTGIDTADEIARIVKLACDDKCCDVAFVPVNDTFSFSERNRRLAARVLNVIGAQGWRIFGQNLPVSESILTSDVIRQAQLPGRRELFDVPVGDKTVVIVLDAGHVAESARLLSLEIKRMRILSDTCIAVFAIRPDKDAAAIAAVLGDICHTVVCTELAGKRGSVEAAVLASLVTKEGCLAVIQDQPTTALEIALNTAQAVNGWVLVIGSFDLVSTLRPAVTSVGKTVEC
ncbi:bifunctional folylpolyglutamate synthase/dihydrofolate synthase [Rhizobium leguminosarum]|uniref:bifunctional folylpolyglutamate synthase/dihydrofolate synthase n=1 Tax=Rhizobium leguminosarum TaxID=384 RepID=UPI001612287E|nr:Mur ligase family protein [Rhizobium leguminosarum]MBB4342981.1 dihydrofolate synthase/folylpolyglutamate synthase [Rhizobium leguminosarum]MBB6296059.1 dihydrofolate synthase/folylpolyglutamate synthase [Rhizobium leguminosarum]